MKLKVKAKNRKDKVKASLLEMGLNDWLNKKENRTMRDDYMELAENCLRFRIMWGIPTEIVIGEIEELKPKSHFPTIKK